MSKLLKVNEHDIADMLQLASSNARKCSNVEELKKVIKDIRKKLVHNIDMRSLQISENQNRGE